MKVNVLVAATPGIRGIVTKLPFRIRGGSEPAYLGNDMYLSHQPLEWDRVSCPFCRERGTTEQEKLARMMKKCPYMAS